jgi:DNA-binding MarR family transcriptional regulator
VSGDDDTVTNAQDLRVAIGRVARRMRQLYATNRAGSTASFTEVAVLVHLQREGPTSPGLLAGREKITSQAISAVLTELTNRALVTRSEDPQDRRKAVVEITDAGRAVLRDHEQAVMEALIQAMSTSFTEAERRRLYAVTPLLNRLSETI